MTVWSAVPYRTFQKPKSFEGEMTILRRQLVPHPRRWGVEAGLKRDNRGAIPVLSDFEIGYSSEEGQGSSGDAVLAASRCVPRILWLH